MSLAAITTALLLCVWMALAGGKGGETIADLQPAGVSVPKPAPSPKRR